MIDTAMAAAAFTSYHVLALEHASPNTVPKFKHSEKCLLIKWLPMVRGYNLDGNCHDEQRACL